ncbi:MAG: hypothetical protein LC751_21825 [Actinobacteria bacterium]|nr:hypothetical protein [Actinomycetota bacterium]
MALGVALSIGVLIGYIIGREAREGSVKTPVGEVTVDQPSSTPVIVRVSGTKGIGYDGTIGTSKTGQKSIDGTLGTTSDDYELALDTSRGSTDIVRAEVGKRAVDNSQTGTLSVDLVAGGLVVREQDSSSETGVVTLTYNAQEAREEL